MDKDGQNLKRLTNHKGWDGYAVWHPNGETIAFDRGELDGDKKAPFIMDLSTGEQKPLGNYEGWLSINDWKDDALLVFWEKNGQRDLYLLDMSGKAIERLTDTPEISEHDAHFSPDGKSIAFASGPASGEGETSLESLDLTTKARKTLKLSSERIYGIDWAPNGKTIAYTDGDDADVYTYDSESATTKKCTSNSSWDHMPEWAPDGKSIMFTSYRTGKERIYLTNCNGTAIRIWAGDSDN